MFYFYLFRLKATFFFPKRVEDLVINLTKTKKISNMRSSGNDDKVKIAPRIIFTLE